MKKLLLFLFTFSLIFIFVGCKKETKEPTKQETKVNETETKPVIEYVYVTFDGTSLEKKQFVKGESLSQPSDPSKNNYIFDGWYTDSSYSTLVEFPLVINNDTTIYAKFNDYKSAYKAARNKTIGSNVPGYEFDYTTSISFSYTTYALSGTTTGNTKYSTVGDISYYDKATNTGALLNDGTKYQIRKNNTLQKLTINEKGVLKKYTVETVDDNYKFDSSSFAKALFTYEDSDIKEIVKTSKSNEYELKTNLNFSQALGTIGNYVNNPIVVSVLGTLPDTNVNTGMYVTFSNGELKTYRYEMHIDVSGIKFDLVYSLTFKNIGVANVIEPQAFTGIAISNNEINSFLSELNNAIDNYKVENKSSYNFTVKTGIDFPDKNEINATFKGSTMRKIDDSILYFHNDIEIDSDYKNNDLYKSNDIKDIHIKKTKLSDGSVYNLEKGLLSWDDTLVENYVSSDTDSYYLLLTFTNFNNINYIQKLVDSKTNEVTYAIGLSNEDVVKLLQWANNNLDLDPFNNATADVLIYGDFSNVSTKECVVEVVLKDNKFYSININANGELSSKLDGSRDFTYTQTATFSLKYELEVTTDYQSYEPFETVKAAKK